MTAVTHRPGPGERTGRGPRAAAWTLVLLAPLCAEVAFSGISMPLILLVAPLLVPMYGAGVLLVRELACRAGAGVPGLLVLGVAYELAEDGLGLQALTSPHLYTAAEWGPRVLGVNTTYWESQVGYHLVFSVLIPVVLTDLIFPARAGRPYLGRFGLVATAAAFAAGLLLVRVGISGVEDPGYRASWTAVTVQVAGIAALVVLALVILPRLRLPRPAPLARPPRPVALAGLVGVATIGFLGLLFPLDVEAGRPAVGAAAWVPVAMAVALAVAAGTGWLVARWSVTGGVTDRHRILVIGGALVGHSLFAVAGGLADGRVVAAPLIGVAVIAVTVALLARLDGRVQRRGGGGDGREGAR